MSGGKGDKRHSNRRYKRNLRRRAKLVEQGYTEDQAREIVRLEGELVERKNMERDQRDATALRALRDSERERFPIQPKNPQSVRDIPAGGFETNRRRH